MKDQIHKRFSSTQIKSLFESYINKEIELSYILSILLISRSRFFDILRSYKQNKSAFSIEYARNNPNRKLASEVEDDILAELYIEKKLIEDTSNPIKYYNYSYIKDLLKDKYDHKVSLPTIIDRAKRFGFKWSPYADTKWYFITTLDDFSRKILYGDFLEAETSWTHIESTESTILKYGLAFSWYVDSHLNI